MVIMTSALLIALGIALLGLSHGYCPTSLPQEVLMGTLCHKNRQSSLTGKQKIFGIRPPTIELPFARLDMEIPQFVGFVMKEDPFLWSHADKWIRLAKTNKGALKKYLNDTVLLPTILDEAGFSQMIQVFREVATKVLGDFAKRPSETEPFQNNMREWISDELFAEQRLAGVNPMGLQRITSSNEVGFNWDKLRQLLNHRFNWECAVSGALNGKSLKTAINDGHLYVLYHPLSDNIQTQPDLGSRDPQRKMWKYTSPIAIFASVPASDQSSKLKLLPVAIQMDHKPDSSVYVPLDGSQWTLAKMNVQRTDLETSQMVEHLSKVHFVSEGLCLSVERQLSKQHPLHAIMRYHCRGVFVANTVGGPTLLGKSNLLDILFPYGYKGGAKLVKAIGELYEWKDLKFQSNVQRRGVDDHRLLPYFPYRDDGAEIERVIKSMVTEYVQLYYQTDVDVQADVELQNYANEVSDCGRQAGGAQVKIRGFPASIDTKEHLVDTFTQMIWLMSGQHAAVNYPLVDYSMYVPNIPIKIYDSTRVPNTKLSPERLPNRAETAEQASFSATLASYRYDRLFDYAEYLDDPRARQVVFRYFKQLNDVVEPLLERRNKARLAQGHLTYPYMQPRWLTNGIQT